MIIWYFVVRRRSLIAKWITSALVAIGIVGLISTLFRTASDDARAVLTLAVIAGLMKAFAVTRLFTAEAVHWFARRPA